MIRALYQIKWTEFERGWGQREIGESYYINKEEANKAYNEAFKGRENAVPDYYINPSEPKLVEVTEKEYQRIKNASMAE